MQCAIGSWVHPIPAESRTGAHSAFMPGLGTSVIVHSFFETWLSLVLAARSTRVRSALLYVGFAPLFQEWAESGRLHSNRFRLFLPCTYSCEYCAAAVWRHAGRCKESVCGVEHTCSSGRRVSAGRRQETVEKTLIIILQYHLLAHHLLCCV